jgi:hypothetical protein
VSGARGRDDQLDVAARYLATGDPTGLPDDGTRRRLDRTLGLLARRCVWEQPPLGLLDAVVDQIQVGRDGGRSDGWGGGRSRPGDGRGRPDRRPRPRARPVSWRLVAAATAAAALVIVGAVVAGTPSLSSRSDRREVALVGTDLAPGATAEAIVHATASGYAVTLDIDGLPPAPPRSYYEAWVKGPRGAVAIGTFHLRSEGDWPIELWTGVDPADYPEITVTLEPEDGDPASSGRTVLSSGADPDPGRPR